jgi:hypothetical protein
VIIWSRWGFLVLVPLGLGAATGALLAWTFLPGVRDGGAYGIFMGIGIMLGGLYTYLFDRYVIERYLDRPRHQLVLERVQLPGGVQTHRQVPLVDPQTGEPLLVRPRSSLFFIPTRIWPTIYVVIGALAVFLSVVTLGSA